MVLHVIVQLINDVSDLTEAISVSGMYLPCKYQYSKDIIMPGAHHRTTNLINSTTERLYVML